MFWRRKKIVLDEPQKEPLFSAASRNDQDMMRAYARAADSIDELLGHLQREGSGTAAIKMRFREPDESERLGEDRFVFLWLLVVEHDASTRRFVVEFLEVPPELLKWHKPGEQLVIDSDQIFDWFVNDDGLMHGGFTMRVTRSRMPEGERAAYDDYTGVRHWVDAAQP